jgi:hypothetical protein
MYLEVEVAFNSIWSQNKFTRSRCGVERFTARFHSRAETFLPKTIASHIYWKLTPPFGAKFHFRVLNKQIKFAYQFHRANGRICGNSARAVPTAHKQEAGLKINPLAIAALVALLYFMYIDRLGNERERPNSIGFFAFSKRISHCVPAAPRPGLRR